AVLPMTRTQTAWNLRSDTFDRLNAILIPSTELLPLTPVLSSQVSPAVFRSRPNGPNCTGYVGPGPMPPSRPRQISRGTPNAFFQSKNATSTPENVGVPALLKMK